VLQTSQRQRIHYRHISRYGEIASVLVKYGFGDLLSRLNIEKYLSVGKRLFRVKQRKHIEAISRWDRVRMALEELGPTFIKLGQFASNRPDVLPPELIASLERLQDSVPPFPEHEAVMIVENELGKPVWELFEHFSETPIASASIAQVHKATLKSGQEVAVKVQRPRIHDQVLTDLEIMYHLAALLEKHIQGIEVINPRQLVDEFSNAIKKELDFTTESMHIDHFTNNFKDDPTVYIPRVYREYASKKVIVTEFIHGIKISNVHELLEAGLDPKEISSRGANAVLKQIFEHGFFHADPHAGNILVKEGNVICFLDLGMTGILTPSARERLSSIIVGIANRNPQRIVNTLYDMSNYQLERKEDLEYEIAELIEEYASRTLGQINIGEVLNRLSKLLIVHRLRIIPGFYLLVKAVVTMEGIGFRLNPGFNMMEHLEPFAKKLINEQFGPLHLAHEGIETVQDLFFLFRDLPSETRDIIQLVKNGRVRIEFVHRGLDPVLRKFDQLVNRMVFGLVLASLVIGSSIVVLSNIPPKIYGLPVIGIGGFLAAGLMGFWLLISILRHEKM
jgi:ubiquinone biosynthesis protein